ncbi:hypothetical protein NKH77_06630 [Streptomyces sp. M19]
MNSPRPPPSSAPCCAGWTSTRACDPRTRAPVAPRPHPARRPPRPPGPARARARRAPARPDRRRAPPSTSRIGRTTVLTIPKIAGYPMPTERDLPPTPSPGPSPPTGAPCSSTTSSTSSCAPSPPTNHRCPRWSPTPASCATSATARASGHLHRPARRHVARRPRAAARRVGPGMDATEEDRGTRGGSRRAPATWCSPNTATAPSTAPAAGPAARARPRPVAADRRLRPYRDPRHGVGRLLPRHPAVRRRGRRRRLLARLAHHRPPTRRRLLRDGAPAARVREELGG